MISGLKKLIDPGFPTPSVHWYQGTMKLVSNNNIRISQTGGRHQLSFIRYRLYLNCKKPI